MTRFMTSTRLTHLSLFSGIGGLDLAAEWAGFTTVGQCEWADYPTKVLEKHWPNVPRWRDIRTLTKGSFYERTGLRTVDIISGGFPCQPFSVAGKQQGKSDDRYLWPEMLRVIRELTPRWVIGENVPGILRIAAEDVVSDLEREGYRVAVFNFEAAAVGAPHRRERVFFVGEGHPVAYAQKWGGRETFERSKTRRSGGNGLLCDPASERFSHRSNEPIEPGLGGMADGISHWLDEPVGVSRVTTKREHRADRLKCLGNAVVPQQAYPIFRALVILAKTGGRGMTKLETCPFCGNVARFSYGEDYSLPFGTDTFVFVMCCSCGIRTAKFYYCPEQQEKSIAETMVAKRWNRRVDND